LKTARTVVTIGTFDGVHVGHAALVRCAREIAEERGGETRVVAMCFDPHPMTLLKPDAAPARLTMFEDKTQLLGTAGAEEVVRLEPTGDLLAMMPDEFLNHVVEELAPLAIVEGSDFRFGRGRAGDLRMMSQYGRSHDFEVHVVSPVEVAMTDHTVAQASSTLARWLIGNGRMRDAAAVLGRDYEVVGRVVKGEQRGRTIGFPTANVETECLVPGDGVYGGMAFLPDGREVAAAISVGNKPTFAGSPLALEAFFLGSPDMTGLEYDWPVRVRVSHWLRDQVRFDSVKDLVRQIDDDCRRVADLRAADAAGRAVRA
jgi:riboflavin kinase/FMN adenylyltransferase